MAMTADPESLRLSEHETRYNQLLTLVQAQRLRTHFSPYLDVTRSFDGEGYDLTAKGYVGVIALPDLLIRIDSKVPVDNLFVMLARAYGLKVDLRDEYRARRG